MKPVVNIIFLFLVAIQFLHAQGEDIFDDTYLHEIRFTEMDSTMLDGSKEYQLVSATIDGSLIDSIGVKEKGIFLIMSQI